MKKLKPIRAFTLMEILIVVIIAGVTASIALPNYLRVTQKMRMQEGVQVLLTILQAQSRYRADTGNFTNAMADLDIVIPPMKNFTSVALGTASAGFRIQCGATNFFYLAGVHTSNGVGTLWINPQGDILCLPCNNQLACGQYGFRVDW